MYERGKSDRPIVPRKSANKGGAMQRSRVGGVDGGKGLGQGEFDPANQDPDTAPDMDLQHALDRIRAAACSDKKMRFTALWHHVYDVDRLRQSFGKLKPKAAAGIDGETWATYAKGLENHLDDLSGRLQRGAYRAKPVRRVYIPKADGRQRPIGIPTLEDKLVQSSSAEVLSAVYETDFKGFSYGFRPGRGAHDALDALSVGLTQRKVNWVLDADIRGFFDAIDHDWLVKFIEHRIADRRVVRHVKKWLNAGVLEDGKKHRPERGTPQGGSISPLLANIYLHYVFDLWADQWRRREAQGDVIIVRYADDFVMGFEHRHEAERFVADLKDRFAKFGLELHPDKTRLIEFGRDARRNRRERGEGKAETFNFLGFTHICGVTRRGWFIVRRQTDAKRRRAKLRELKEQLRCCMHESIGEVGRWLGRVVRGHYAYFAVPLNSKALNQFRFTLIGMWHRTLKRRSQRAYVTMSRMKRIADQWLPQPRILHPYPSQRLRLVTTRGRSPVR